LRSSDPGDDHRSPSPEAGQDLVSDEIVQKGFEVVSLASAANVIVQRAMSVDEGKDELGALGIGGRIKDFILLIDLGFSGQTLMAGWIPKR
jgi:hypothetical protein